MVRNCSFISCSDVDLISRSDMYALGDPLGAAESILFSVQA